MRINTDQGILPQSILHIIRSNDTFYELAKTYNTTSQNIIALNPLLNPHNLQIGTPILISPGSNWWQNTQNQQNVQNTQNTQAQENVQQDAQQIPVTPNRTHPIQRPSTQPQTIDDTWPIFDNSHRFGQQPNLQQQPNQPIQPQNPNNANGNILPRQTSPIRSVLPNVTTSPITTVPTPSAPVTPIQPIPAPVTPIQPVQPLPQPISPQPITPNPLPITPVVPINPQLPHHPIPPSVVQHCCNSSMCGQMRMLWAQKIYWTRMLLNSIVDRTNQANANMQRLLANPTDMGNLFSRYYGNQIGQQVANLYRTHVNLTRDMIVALRDNRTTEAIRLQTLWYENADEIIRLLTSFEENINEDELRRAMYQHLEKTELQIAQQIGNNPTDSINTFNNVETQAMELADMLSNSILGIKANSADI